MPGSWVGSCSGRGFNGVNLVGGVSVVGGVNVMGEVSLVCRDIVVGGASVVGGVSVVDWVRRGQPDGRSQRGGRVNLVGGSTW